MQTTGTNELSYSERVAMLRATKMRHTEEKWREIGSLDMDDLPIMLPPPEVRKVVRIVSGSGIVISDALFNNFVPKTDRADGGIFGARACGENFRALLDLHPPYVDPVSSLAGGYMASFLAYRQPAWNPDFDYSHLHEEQNRYKLHHGIGAVQHFCQDMTIGFTLGWGGLLEQGPPLSYGQPGR